MRHKGKIHDASQFYALAGQIHSMLNCGKELLCLAVVLLYIITSNNLLIFKLLHYIIPHQLLPYVTSIA